MKDNPVKVIKESLIKAKVNKNLSNIILKLMFSHFLPGSDFHKALYSIIKKSKLPKSLLKPNNFNSIIFATPDTDDVEKVFFEGPKIKEFEYDDEVRWGHSISKWIGYYNFTTVFISAKNTDWEVEFHTESLPEQGY